jgi:hypothetical protein
MNTTTRVQQPTTTRAPASNPYGKNTELANQVTAFTPAPTKMPATRPGPTATAQPRPTTPARQQHLSTEQHLAQTQGGGFVPHEAALSDLEGLIQRERLGESADRVVRRAVEHARQGCPTCATYLRGLTAGFRGAEQHYRVGKFAPQTQAQKPAASTRAAQPTQPAQRGAMPQLPRQAQPGYPLAARTQRIVAERLQQIEQERLTGKVEQLEVQVATLPSKGKPILGG